MRAQRRFARWKYLVNGLVLLAPAWFLYESPTPPTLPKALPERELGPFTAVPRPANDSPPYEHDGRYLKDFSVELCAGCTERIRTAYLMVSEAPPALPDDGFGVIHGYGAIQHVHAPYPRRPGEGARLWLTIQGWDGRIHRASWTLPGLET